MTKPTDAAAAMLCLLALAGAAQAEGNPYSLGAGLAYASDDNLFRAPPGETVGDRFTTASVSAGVDQTIGRQRLQAHATLRHSWFEERGDLDHTGHQLRLGWDGATAGEFSWALSYEADRRLASYAAALQPELRVANIETGEQWLARAQLGLSAQWVGKLALSHREIDYSAAAYANQQLRIDALGLGVTWNPLGPLSVSLGPRFTRGRYPQARRLADGSVEADGFQRRDLDLGLNWRASGASTLEARFSLTRQRDDRLEARDFDGATSLVGWQWAATGKTRLSASLSRDTGSETSFVTGPVDGQTLRGSGDNSRLSTSLAARVDHELTGKISLNAGGAYTLRRLGASGVPATDDEAGNDRTGRLFFGLRYAPTRLSVLGCGLAYERRGTRTVLSSAYRVKTASCSAEITLQ